MFGGLYIQLRAAEFLASYATRGFPSLEQKRTGVFRREHVAMNATAAICGLR